MKPGKRLRRPGPWRAALGLVALLALASCQAGWVSPITGDGTAGTTTGTVADAQAQLTDPTGVVAIPGGGFYVYDAAACAIYKDSMVRPRSTQARPGRAATVETAVGPPRRRSTTRLSGDPVAKTSVHGHGRDSSTPMALGSDGSLYFVELTIVGWVSQPGYSPFPDYSSQVRKIAPDGTISAVGNEITSSPTTFITGLTTTPGGSVLVAVASSVTTRPRSTRSPLTAHSPRSRRRQRW